MSILQEAFSGVPAFVSPLHSAYITCKRLELAIENMDLNSMSIEEIMSVNINGHISNANNGYYLAHARGTRGQSIPTYRLNFSRVPSFIGDNDYV
jgi:hypothetical protein